MRNWIAALSGLAAAFATACGGRAAPPTDAPLTAEDCKVWVAVGQKLYGWGAQPADRQQFKIFYRPAGGGYAQQCPWSKLGVAPPAVNSYDPAGPYVYFTGPDYAGPSKATVSATTVFPLPGGAGASIDSVACTLTRLQGRWTVTACQLGPRT